MIGSEVSITGLRMSAKIDGKSTIDEAKEYIDQMNIAMTICVAKQAGAVRSKVASRLSRWW